jgi:hypothetical protein
VEGAYDRPVARRGARTQGRNRRRGGVLGYLADRPGLVVSLAVVAVIVVAAVVGKLVAERSADGAMRDRVRELQVLLDGATTEDFLAFNAGVRREGSLAQQIRDQPDFVNVRATADLSFIRFQPDGWWTGFTERCVVARVTPDGVRVAVRKTACVRVPAPN